VCHSKGLHHYGVGWEATATSLRKDSQNGRGVLRVGEPSTAATLTHGGGKNSAIANIIGTLGGPWKSVGPDIFLNDGKRLSPVKLGKGGKGKL